MKPRVSKWSCFMTERQNWRNTHPRVYYCLLDWTPLMLYRKRCKETCEWGWFREISRAVYNKVSPYLSGGRAGSRMKSWTNSMGFGFTIGAIWSALDALNRGCLRWSIWFWAWWSSGSNIWSSQADQNLEYPFFLKAQMEHLFLLILVYFVHFFPEY